MTAPYLDARLCRPESFCPSAWSVKASIAKLRSRVTTKRPPCGGRGGLDVTLSRRLGVNDAVRLGKKCKRAGCETSCRWWFNSLADGRVLRHDGISSEFDHVSCEHSNHGSWLGMVCGLRTAHQ